MSYNPIEGQDIRVVYLPETRQLQVEQVRIRRANGAFHPEDLGAITDLDIEFWEPRAICLTIDEMVERCVDLMIKENVKLRSIDLGPTSPQASTVQAAITKLATIRV